MNSPAEESVNKTYILLIIVMMLWGGTFVAGRHLAATFDPFVIAFYRFLSASIVLVLATVYRQGKLPRLDKWQILKVFFLGFTGVLCYNYFFFAGLARIEAGRASVIIATNPTITALLAPIFLKEEFTPRKFLGVLLALTGALTVITHGAPWLIFQEGIGVGELFLFGAVLTWVTYTLLGKVALKKLSPLEATTYACLIGTTLLFPFALKNGLLDFPVIATSLHWFNIFFLGVLATAIGFIWYYQGIRHIGAARAAAFINFVPLFGLTSGALFLGETPDSSLLSGALLVIAGVSLANLKKISFKRSQE